MYFLNKSVINLFVFKHITLQQCLCGDRKTLMKINVSGIWNAHLALRYFISRAIVLYVALLITRWFDRQNEKGRCRERNDIRSAERERK